MASLFDSFGEFLSNTFSSSKEEPMQSRQDYMKDALYFKKGSEVNDPRPGNKINRSQVDSIVYAANLGVTTGLMDKDMGDRFIANQFQELRNDFAVNAKDKKGETIKLPVTPGSTYRAADTLYGLKSGDGVTFYEPDRAAGKGREFSSEGKRYRTVDPNSPYVENIPPEQLQSNAKIALLTWLSKKGKDIDETTMNWNGDQRYGAKEHLAKVKRREEDLGADYNKDLRDYIVERVAYDSKYKGKSNSLYDQAVKEFPYLKDKNISYKESFGKGKGFLEFYDPDEPGSPESPRPKELPMGKVGIEVFDKNTRPIDVLADYTSHWAIENDPKVKGIYSKFKGSLDDKQKETLKKQYKYAQDNEGETRPYEVWEERTGLPGYLRGYTFDQWPAAFNSKAYRKDQIQLLDSLRDYLGVKSKK